MQVIKDKERYHAFIEANAHSIPLFYYPHWLDTVTNGKWEVLLAIKDEKIIAVLPYHYKTKYGLNAIVMPRLTPYLGIYFDKNIEHKFQEGISKELVKALPRFFYTNICFDPTYTNWLPWRWAGFQQRTRYTHIILNQAYEDVIKNFSNTLLAHMRRGEKTLQVIKSDDLETMWQCVLSSYRKNGYSPPFNLDYVKRIYQNHKNATKIYLAVDNQNKCHASLLTVEDDYSVYHILSGRMLDAYRGAVPLIMSRSINEAMINGKHYDFEGSSIEGIANFYRSFGAKQIPYIQVYKSWNRMTDAILSVFGNF